MTFGCFVSTVAIAHLMLDIWMGIFLCITMLIYGNDSKNVYAISSFIYIFVTVFVTVSLITNLFYYYYLLLFIIDSYAKYMTEKQYATIFVSSILLLHI